jgi:hypothetical protein
LLLIRNYQNPSRVSTYTGGGLIPTIIDESMGSYSYMYLLEDGTGYIRAVSPKDKQPEDALLDFFPKEYLDKSAPPSGAFKYKDLLQLVKEYDSL